MVQRKPDTEIIFDGDCSICRAHSRYLSRVDAGIQRFKFTNTAEAGFDSSAYGLEKRDVEGQLYVKLPDDSVVEGMEALRRIYAGTQVGWVLYATKFPIIRHVSDALYVLFARNRRRLAGLIFFKNSAGFTD